MWAVVPTLISHIGGWAALAQNYTAQEPFTGRTWSFQRGQMRWFTGYNNCLTVGADPRGLYLSMFLLLRIGHPPLFIPWHDISYVTGKIFWTRYVEFRLGPDLNIPLRVSESLAEKLKAAAGTNWPIQAVA